MPDHASLALAPWSPHVIAVPGSALETTNQPDTPGAPDTTHTPNAFQHITGVWYVEYAGLISDL